MSRKKSKQQTPSRAAKRARFEEQKKGSGGASPLILVAGTLVVLILIGGAIFAFTREPTPSAGSLASASSADLDSYGTGSKSLLVTAATVGHDPYPLVEAVDGVVRLPLSTFDDYQAHHFTYVHEGHSAEFFVLKSQDGVVRAAFNACDVCFSAKKGYTQDGDHMICNNCGRRFPADQINVLQGGCNPSPLTRTVDGDSLIIEVEDILAGLGYF